MPNGVPDLPQGSLPESKHRYRLRSGYVVSTACSLGDVYSDITYKEYIEYNTKKGVSSWPDELLEPRIIRQRSISGILFLTSMEFNKRPRIFTIGEINAMIENGTLETVFTTN